MNLEEWDSLSKVEVSTQELDEMISKMDQQWRDYEEKKKIASAAHEEYERTEKHVLTLLKQANKSKYFVEKLGTVSIRNRYVVRVPKDLESKRVLFDYIRSKHGADELLALTTINHQTLNAFVNAEKENNPLVSVPGLEAPTHEESLVFRGAAK